MVGNEEGAGTLLVSNLAVFHFCLVDAMLSVLID